MPRFDLVPATEAHALELLSNISLQSSDDYASLGLDPREHPREPRCPESKTSRPGLGNDCPDSAGHCPGFKNDRPGLASHCPGNFQLCPDCQVQRLLYNRSQRCAILSVIGWSRFEAGFPISGLSPDGFCFLLSQFQLFPALNSQPSGADY